MPKLHFELEELLSLHRFGDTYADTISSIESDKVSFEVLRSAKDSIGRHWYGMRCRVTTKARGLSFYLHTGLIYLPETKIGLMVEVDRKNNLTNYSDLWTGLTDTALFTVNRAEEEYLKLFMPDADFERMNTLSCGEQKRMLADYMKACAEAICDTAEQKAFRISTESLLNTLYLGRALKKVITETASSKYTIEINEADPDNFGQYASGYRYYLKNSSGTVTMYAYFGAIYSYKKRPAGIFAEIDWFSNQQCFDKVKANFKHHAAYEWSDAEEKFIKLFMPEKEIIRFNEADEDEQIEILKTFFDVCSSALAEASEG